MHTSSHAAVGQACAETLICVPLGVDTPVSQYSTAPALAVEVFFNTLFVILGGGWGILTNHIKTFGARKKWKGKSYNQFWQNGQESCRNCSQNIT